MNINNNSGLLAEAVQIPSCNFDDRPPDTPIRLIVIHNISLPAGEFGGPYITQLFTNQLCKLDHPSFEKIHQLKVSSHILIRRDAEIIQYVPFNKRAWHAGVSNYCGQEACNDFSIGIELEGTDNCPYEKQQYIKLAELILTLQQNYPEIDKNAITGHCDIAPGRKTDPGPSFDWYHLNHLLQNNTQ